MADRNAVYADALLAIIHVEGAADEASDELFRFARTLESSDELWAALGDPHIPAERRQQIVQDLLQGSACDATVAAVSLIVGLGRARDLPAIVDHLVEASAAAAAKQVAEVRVAKDLTDDQRSRLTAALSSAVGGEVEVKVVIDPGILGGVHAQIGDRVIDGTVRTRLNQLRESF